MITLRRTAHPLPVTARPIFACRPLFVSGTPIALDIFLRPLVMPRERFNENLFIRAFYQHESTEVTPEISVALDLPAAPRA